MRQLRYYSREIARHFSIPLKYRDMFPNAFLILVTINDKFDFTEFKNPFNQNSTLKSILWAANDIAYYDSKWGLLDEVDVTIDYNNWY